jgi:thiamine kinase
MTTIIAHGATADVLAWDAGYILKLFHTGTDRATVEREAHITRAVHAVGVPVPVPGQVVEHDGRYGLVYERVDGAVMAEQLYRHPWELFRFARMLAKLHHELHFRPAPDLRRQRIHLEHKIRHADIEDDLKQAALDKLADLPDGDALCHGDFHPANVMVTSHGTLIIDWQDASIGNPLADVARSLILIRIGIPAPGLSGMIMRASRLLFGHLYLAHYIRLNPGTDSEIQRWIPVVAAARLSENIPEKAALQTFVRRAPALVKGKRIV